MYSIQILLCYYLFLNKEALYVIVFAFGGSLTFKSLDHFGKLK